MILKLKELEEMMQKAKEKGKPYTTVYKEDDTLLIIKAYPDNEEFLFMEISLYEHEKIGNTIYCTDTYANKWVITADEVYGFYEDEIENKGGEL